MHEMRQKKCIKCGEPFQPFRSTDRVCGNIECRVAFGVDVAEKAKAKRERQEAKERKERLKTKSDLMRDAQKAFNAYIRERDRIAGYPCISSGRPLNWTGNQVDAGHYRSVGSAPHLRFNEDNCHAQSKHDNRFLSGNAVDYRIGLIARIGLERVEALEADQTDRKYTADDLKEIIRVYRQKTKELLKQ